MNPPTVLKARAVPAAEAAAGTAAARTNPTGSTNPTSTKATAAANNALDPSNVNSNGSPNAVGGTAAAYEIYRPMSLTSPTGAPISLRNRNHILAMNTLSTDVDVLIGQIPRDQLATFGYKPEDVYVKYQILPDGTLQLFDQKAGRYRSVDTLYDKDSFANTHQTARLITICDFSNEDFTTLRPELITPKSTLQRKDSERDELTNSMLQGMTQMQQQLNFLLSSQFNNGGFPQSNSFGGGFSNNFSNGSFPQSNSFGGGFSNNFSNGGFPQSNSFGGGFSNNFSNGSFPQSNSFGGGFPSSSSFGGGAVLDSLADDFLMSVEETQVSSTSSSSSLMSKEDFEAAYSANLEAMKKIAAGDANLVKYVEYAELNKDLTIALKNSELKKALEIWGQLKPLKKEVDSREKSPSSRVNTLFDRNKEIVCRHTGFEITKDIEEFLEAQLNKTTKK